MSTMPSSLPESSRLPARTKIKIRLATHINNGLSARVAFRVEDENFRPPAERVTVTGTLESGLRIIFYPNGDRKLSKSGGRGRRVYPSVGISSAIIAMPPDSLYAPHFVTAEFDGRTIFIPPINLSSLTHIGHMEINRKIKEPYTLKPAPKPVPIAPAKVQAPATGPAAPWLLELIRQYRDVDVSISVRGGIITGFELREVK